MLEEDKANTIFEYGKDKSKHTELVRISLPKSATVGSVEKTLDNLLREVGSEPVDLEIDMSSCAFIETGTLIFLIALMAYQQQKQLSTRLRIPRSKKVRDFLRVWEFPQAVRDALGLKFLEVVCEEDHKYFGENKDSTEKLEYGGYIADTGKGKEILPSQWFYSIKTIFPSYVASQRLLAEEQSAKWKEQYIISILTRHLSGSGTRISSHIIFEAIMNALRHPGASKILTSSFFDRSYGRNKKAKGYFTIVFWDDGESAIDTLMKAVNEGREIRAVDVPRLYANYELNVEDEDANKLPPQIVRSDFLPEQDTSEDLFLLAVTFPGVTRDITGEGHHVDPAVLEEDEVFGMPGMGLHVLTNTAVDVFGGMVSLRTKSYFMNIKASPNGTRSKDKVRYLAKIKQYGDWMPQFPGNMLTIRLPLRVKL